MTEGRYEIVQALRELKKTLDVETEIMAEICQRLLDVLRIPAVWALTIVVPIY